MEFRDAANKIPYGVEPIENEAGSIIGFGGSIGPYIYSLLIKMISPDNVTIVKTPNNEQLGSNMGNDTYNGAIGMLQRGEADFSFIAHGMLISENIVDYSHTVGGIKGKIGHFPEILASHLTILDTLLVFTPVIWLSFSLSILLVTAYLLLFEPKSLEQILNVLLNTCGVFINQCSIDKFAVKSFVVTTVLLTSGFMFMEVYENSIQAESVSVDYSGVYSSIDDVVTDPKAIPSFIKDDPFTLFVQSHPNVKYRSLYNNEHASSFKFDPSEIPMDFHKRTMIANEYIVSAVGKMSCGKGNHQRAWIAQQHFADLPVAHSTSKRLSIDHKKRFDQITVRVAATGVHDAIWMAGNNIGLSALGSSDKCNCKRMQDLYDVDDMITGIPFASFYSVILVSFIAIFAAVMALICEMAKFKYFATRM